MRKKHLMIVLLMVICAVMMAGCSGKMFTKSQGPSPEKMVARPGDLPALVVDQRIDSCPGCPPAAKGTTAAVNKKDKFAKADKFEKENLELAMSVEFEFAKHFVREQYHDGLKKVADSMKENPGTKAILKGHTDNVGSKAYNLRLSKVRANSVKLYLVKEFGINKSRIATFGYGFSKPVADNSTEEGRQKNRRVEIYIKGTAK
ncbi:MAG TPA: OmpA family protein [Smithella sp.]|nr:OmpA family protein [Smithella sp.]